MRAIRWLTRRQEEKSTGNSVAMSRDLARARLLTVRGYGHTEFANPSTCAADYEVSYLTTGALPPAGTVCTQDGTPFASKETS